ncbi:MAG: dihydropyrimidine dehydrogenase subunit PreA [Gaiellaceae bacterium]|nr:dihydropyrimidine dehydrogenase subunit PreA [Gaiellaceae bacterium]
MADTLLSGINHAQQLPEEERESYRVAIERFCFVNDLEAILDAADVGHAYKFRKPYPQEPGSVRQPQASVTWRPDATLFGKPSGFPVGVPASVLTRDSRWIRYFRDHGFNVFTFKTVRSREWSPLPFPNWVFLDDADEPLAPGVTPGDITKHGDTATYLHRLQAFSMANSFGVPSKSPEEWTLDVKRAAELLQSGQTLIVSVMGSSEPTDPPDALVADFVAVARLALEAGAPAIELNLSCPNTLDLAIAGAGVKPPLCESVEDTLRVVEAVANELAGAVPLVAKLGYLARPKLEQMVRALSPYVSAFSGINTFQVRVESRRALPTFGERELAGISGIALRHLALDFVRSLHSVRQKLNLSYEILGMGGVMDAADVYALLAVGADAVQTATAAAINPSLPLEIAAFGGSHPSAQQDIVETARAILYDEAGNYRPAADVMPLIGLPNQFATQLDNLDRPRKLVELLAAATVSSEPEQIDEDEPLDEAVWGAPPPVSRVRESEKLAINIFEQQRKHLLGQLMTTEEFGARAGWPGAAVIDATNRGDIIYFEQDGRLLFPAWQFSSDIGAELLPELRTLRHMFGGDVVALGTWIETAIPELNGRSPRQALADGDVEAVLQTLTTLALAL